MGLAEYDGSLAEVLVECHQDPILIMGLAEDLFVTGVFPPLTSPHNVVPPVQERLHGATPDAGIQQQLHATESVTLGSNRSCPTSRWA